MIPSPTQSPSLSRNHQHHRTRAALRAYLALMLVNACCFLLEYAPQPMYNTISQAFGSSRGATGMVVGVFQLSLTLSPLFVGLFLARLGIRRAILAATALLGASGLGIWLAGNFHTFMVMRTVQALLVPLVLTAVMTAVSRLFRHLNLGMALAGYVTVNLAGSLSGRLLGGLGAQYLGWRPTLLLTCLLFFLVLPILWHLPEVRGRAHVQPRFRDYRAIWRQPGVPSVVLAEAFGLFTFAAVGNLVPFRMAELGQGSSAGLVGLMYVGYAIGLASPLILPPLKRLFGTNAHVLFFCSLVYMLATITLTTSSIRVLFAGIWGMAFGQFVVHAMSPGLVNILAAPSQASRAMVNGLYLSCFYFGGVMGSWLPGTVYEHFGWTACYLSLQASVCLTFLILAHLAWKMPGLR